MKMPKISRIGLERARQIDRDLGRHVERFSRFLWPWRVRWLLLMVGSLIICDFTSTYGILKLSGKPNVYEGGLLAAWALGVGGFPFLLVIDLLAIGILCLIAILVRNFYIKRGSRDYGRAAFVILLIPYIVVTCIAIINNIIMTLL